jgi:hypothetical protein
MSTQLDRREGAMDAVEDYISYCGAHQWQQLRTVFDHSGFTRTGYADLFTDVDKYVDFLEEIVPTLGADYQLQIEPIVYAPGEKVAFAELIEHLELEGVMTDLPETIIFDVNDEGLIRRMSLYLKQPGGLAPDGGQDPTGATGG